MVNFTDGRIKESSSLAMSVATPTAFWTNNDEKKKPHCFLVDSATGKTIGTFSFKNATDIVDPEALSVDNGGRLWYADIGDNSAVRKNVALYMVAEPGPGDHGELKRSKFLLKYPGGPRNAETLLTRSTTNEMFIISKESSSQLYQIPATLQSAASGGVNKLVAVSGATFGSNVSDGAFTPDGKWVIVLRAASLQTAYVYSAADWTLAGTITFPNQVKPEGITVARDQMSIWVGSEGVNAPIHNVAMPGAYQAVPTTNTPLPADFQMDGPTPANPCG